MRAVRIVSSPPEAAINPPSTTVTCRAWDPGRVRRAPPPPSSISGSYICRPPGCMLLPPFPAKPSGRRDFPARYSFSSTFPPQTHNRRTSATATGEPVPSHERRGFGTRPRDRQHFIVRLSCPNSTCFRASDECRLLSDAKGQGAGRARAFPPNLPLQVVRRVVPGRVQHAGYCSSIFRRAA